jgi:aminoglycoside 6-adenylyltransferase
MRDSEEMMGLFEGMAQRDERIRAMTLEGSRVNPNITPDVYQDYDLTFLVTDVKSFRASDDWLAEFGNCVFMQKPEAMSLFPPDFPEGWFSYLMIFEDGVKIDLTLVPVKDVEAYFAQDPLIRVLLDKDGVCTMAKAPSDEQFWVQEPSWAYFEDCCNQFWQGCHYMAKGLLRGQQLYANHMMEQVARSELLRMLGWYGGTKKGFPINCGKYDRDIPGFLTKKENEMLFATYRLDSIENGWEALRGAEDLFHIASWAVSEGKGYAYPNFEFQVRSYIETLKKL